MAPFKIMERIPESSTITKVSDLLEALSRIGRPASLNELAEVLAFPKPTLRRLLLQLKGVGMVMQDEDSRLYRLGSRLITLAAAVLEGMEVRRAASDILDDLMKATGESSYLAVLDQINSVYVDLVECDRSVKVLTKVGARRLAWTTATGKVMLAFLPNEERKRRLSAALRVSSAMTLPDPALLAAQLRSIREAGFAVSRDEAEIGVTGVAAPVLDAAGDCVAALALGIPTYRFSPALEALTVEATVAAAERLSERMKRLPSHTLAST